MTDAGGPLAGANGGGTAPACEEVRMALGGYVLAGLEPDEAGRVEGHLGACRSCAAEAADLAPMPELLALLDDAPPEPPAGVRTRVLDDVRRRRPARRRVAGLAAALLTAAVVSGAAVVALSGSGEDPEAPADQASVTTELHAGEGTDATGELTLTPSGSGLLVEVEATGLERLPPRGVYEAWLRKPGREEPVSIGRFEPGQGGTAVTFTASGGPDDYDGFWITAEPDAADPAHQGPTVLWADIP